MNRLFRRFGPMGRLADVLLVGGVAGRLAHRMGWVSDETAQKLFSPTSAAGKNLSMGELVIAGGAAIRLVQQLRRRRNTTRVVIDV